MKKISINLFFLLLVVSCKSQEKQTFQDYLSNYINEKDYLNNGFPSLEFQKNDEITAIFWLNIKHKKYLIFSKNSKIYFVLGCGELPIGEDNIGNIKLVNKDIYDRIINNKFFILNNNLMNNYSIVNSFNIDEVIENTPYKKNILKDEYFIPIEVNLEIPVVFLKTKKHLLITPLEW